jgi:hypothetical protein
VTGGADIRYSVFEPLQSGKEDRAAVLVNFGDREETATVTFPGMEGRNAEISAPFEPDRKADLPLRLTIPPQRCAVVVSR